MQELLWTAARNARALLVVVVGLAAGVGGAAAQDADPIQATYGAWDIRCPPQGECYMSQSFANDSGQPVLLMRIQKLAAPQNSGGRTVSASAQIITPLDVFLPSGLGMTIDGGPVVSAPFIRCRAAGCLSSPPLTDDLVAQFKAGGNAIFIMVRQPGQAPFEAPISLNGFTAAFDAL